MQRTAHGGVVWEVGDEAWLGDESGTGRLRVRVEQANTKRVAVSWRHALGGRGSAWVSPMSLLPSCDGQPWPLSGGVDGVVSPGDPAHCEACLDVPEATETRPEAS